MSSMRILIISTIFLISIISCKKDTDLGIENLIGSWTNPVYSDSTICFAKDFLGKRDSYLLTFKSEGKLVEHKNSGWCGTPPISYADFNGTWSLLDSTLTISVGFWGGTEVHEWEIIQIDNRTLKVKTLLYNNTFVPE